MSYNGSSITTLDLSNYLDVTRGTLEIHYVATLEEGRELLVQRFCEVGGERDDEVTGEYSNFGFSFLIGVSPSSKLEMFQHVLHLREGEYLGKCSLSIVTRIDPDGRISLRTLPSQRVFPDGWFRHRYEMKKTMQSLDADSATPYTTPPERMTYPRPPLPPAPSAIRRIIEGARTPEPSTMDRQAEAARRHFGLPEKRHNDK